MRILIVEDDNVDREAAERVLAKLGVETVAVGTLREAMLLDQYEHFDLIVLDYFLPDRENDNVSRFFTADTRANVVILTGEADLLSQSWADTGIQVLSKSDFADDLSSVIEGIAKRLSIDSA